MKMASIIVLIVSMLTLSACQPLVDPMKVEKVDLDTELQKRSYTMGASIGQIVKEKLTNHKAIGVEYDKNMILKGFIAALQNQSQLNNEDIQSITQQAETLVSEKQIELKIQKGKENKIKGLAFLTENAKRENVIVLDSGLQYEVLKNAKGRKPAASDTVTVHYLGTLIDGTEFDSSFARNKPTTFPLNRVIKGWTEGLQLMSVGAKYKFYVPSNLAYGARSTGEISSHSTLIFEVELLDVIESNKPATK
ncbi:MAG: FKBP-type peptidyl-prolyl cis-trans isomerase [Paraglaciecola sp.]|uniref:FKBP-type peptidyl-prolyl cis-trans isomerase n=1 Tax=Paraglaciecola sp. TaxID=1920173 RepID=UPI003296D49B